uniref:Carotenoid cleavage dioxygenase 7 n=1 Tax=Kalanchoe fedtschenkoi TaxID=63787 RepID=A0A7N0T059_KALFE
MISTTTMQAQNLPACIPTPFPSPAATPSFPMKPKSPIALKPPLAISISTPDLAPAASPPVKSRDRVIENDSIAAFWDYQFLFVSQRAETAQPITLKVIDGQVPSDFPLGTYFLTGPGLFKDDHGSTVHPLDGHGYLRSFTVASGGNGPEVRFMARYVRTEAQAEECDPVTGTWRFTHRGPFSVLRGGQRLGNTKVMKNVANTSVLWWGGRLLCLWEGGEPYEIETTSLDTVGKFPLIDGADEIQDKSDGGDVWDVAAKFLKPILRGVFKMPPRRLLSHYKIDPTRNRLIIVSCNAEDMLLPSSHFTFYEYDLDFKLIQKQEFNIPDHMMIHDWAFTDNHYVVFANRIKLDIPGSITAVCGLSPMITALSVNPSKSTSPIYLLPRFSDEVSGQRDWKVPIELDSQLWLLHTGNAFEDRDSSGAFTVTVQASACSYQWFNFQKMFGYDWRSGKLDPNFMNIKEGDKSVLPHLVQISIKMNPNGATEKCSIEPLATWSKAADFPVINQAYAGAKSKYIYAATSSGNRQALPDFPFDTVVKMDTEGKTISTWFAGRRRFIGEPIFVPRGGVEDDGYLVVVEYAVSIQKCFLVILDASRVGEAGQLVARLEVPKHFNFPIGFHGFWAKQV